MFVGAGGFGGAFAFGFAVGVSVTGGDVAGGEANGGILSRWAFLIADGLLSKKAFI